MTFDPWALEPATGGTTGTTATLVEDKFPDSLIKRAKKRDVYENEGNGWHVKGSEALGDSRWSYHVTLNSTTRKYHCDCHDTLHGETRRRRVCSHVVAVLLFRQEQQKGGGDSTTPHNTEPELDGFVYRSDIGEGEPPTISLQADAMLPLSVSDIPSVNDERWGSPPLPMGIQEIRPPQWDAVQEVVEAFHSFGEDGGVVWLDGPTGAGKTLIAELVRRELKTRALYTCSSKTLQDQFLASFDYANVLKGRGNYPTELMPFPEFTTSDCGLTACNWCMEMSSCPYQQAKRAAMRSQVAVLNTSYLLAEANYVGDVVKQPGLVVMDECDTLERELMGFVEFNLADRVLKELGVEAPKKGSHKSTIREWMVDDLLTAVKDAVGNVPGNLDEVKVIRRQQRLNTLRQKAALVASQLSDDDELWIRDNDAGPLVMKPVSVATYGDGYLWRHGKRWLCMSATIISDEELSQSLGVPERMGQAVVRVPMTFPVENRRIIVAPVANMVAKEKETAWPRMAEAIRGVMGIHPDERILVHTVSYELAKFLQGELRDTGRKSGRSILSYTRSADRDYTLERFRVSDAGVLLAPSLDRGIDLAGDECRVIVVAKLPYPYLGDKQVSARMHTPGGQAWYSVQTVRTLVQMCGRGVRSKEDWCLTYVLDSQMQRNLLKRSGHLLPGWYRDALDKSFPTRKLLAG